MLEEVAIITNINKKAESDIISSLFDLELFNKVSTKRMLSQYPYCENIDKIQLIKDILVELWSTFADKDYVSNLFIEMNKFDHLFILSNIRGHFIHQFEVFLLGLSLLKFDNYVNSDGNIDEINNIAVNWLVISTAHDFGYQIEKCNHSFLSLSQMYQIFDFNLISKFFNIISRLISKLRFFELSKWTDSRTFNKFFCDSIVNCTNLNDIDTKILFEKLRSEYNHGYVSSFIVNKIFKNYFNSDSFEMLHKEKIISSIGLHHVLKHIDYRFKIDYKINSYSAVLLIVNNLQDWSREIVKELNLSSCYLKNYTLDFSTKTVNLEFLIEHSQWDPEKKDETIKWIEKKLNSIKNISLRPETERIFIDCKYIYTSGQPIAGDKIII